MNALSVENSLFESEHTNRLLPGLVAAATVAAAGILIDPHTLAEQRRLSKETEISYQDNGAERISLVLLGCRTKRNAVKPLLEPVLGKDANTAYVDYAEGEITLKDVGQKLLDFREQHGKRTPFSVAALSMGGIFAARLFADHSFRQEFGHVDTLLLDSCPHDRDDVRWGTRLALEAARVTRYSKPIDHLSQHVQLRHAATSALAHEADVRDEDVLKHQKATITTPLYIVARQVAHINRLQLPKGALRDVADSVHYLQSPYDSVIKTEQSFAKYQMDFGGIVNRLIDPARPHGSHAAMPEYRTLPATLLAGRQLTAEERNLYHNDELLTRAG